MIITKIRLSYHQTPLSHPFVTALRRIESVQFVRVHIYSDTGEIGIGEAPPTKAITGETVESITEAIEKNIMPKILHLTIQEAINFIFTCKEKYTSALAAVDIALYDLLPSLKEKKISSLKTAIAISLNRPEMMAIHTQEALKSGLDILKIKLGAKDSQDFARIKAVCEVAGSTKILLDANQAWSIDEETTALLAMEYPKTVKYIDLDSPLLYKESVNSIIHFKNNELSL